MLGLIRELRSAGLLGINRRNADFTLQYNSRTRQPLVDNKVTTKQLAIEAGLAVPELYEVICETHQVDNLAARLAERGDFALKPAHGSGGQGIMVISGSVKENFKNISGRLIDFDTFEHHVINILSGLYSLGGIPDQAMIEYRVRPHPFFEPISFKGVPDIRIIVFLGVPVMAMMRLPSSLSDGKANLHQGALGVGIKIGTGKTVAAVRGNCLVSDHPDTGAELIGLEIPNWRDLLQMAAKCHTLSGLGYQGVDLVIDRDKGPMILELNARPGLNIQLANRSGLLPRLERIKAAASELTSLEGRITFSQENF